MQRRDIIKALGAGTAALATTSSLAAPAVNKGITQWRMASSFPKNLDAIYGAGELLAKRVAALTNNQFQIRVFAANELVPALGVFDAVHKGTIECGHSASYYNVGKNKAFAFETGLPFGLTARQQNAWYLQGGGRALVQEFLNPYGVQSFMGGNTGGQMGGWFRKPINSLADLKGLKMRIPGIGGEIMARLGALPQTLGGADVFPALERGVIDAAEWIGPYDDNKMGFHKAAKYYYFPGWWETGPQLSFYANSAEWAKLPKSFQVAFEVASVEASSIMLAMYDARNPKAMIELINKHQVKLMAYPQDLLKAAQKTAFAFYNEEAAGNKAFAKIYKHWQPFRNLSHGWTNLAETSMENFMYKTPNR